MCIYLYIYIYIYKQVCWCIYIYTYMYIYIHILLGKEWYMWVYMCMCVYIYMYEFGHGPCLRLRRMCGSPWGRQHWSGATSIGAMRVHVKFMVWLRRIAITQHLTDAMMFNITPMGRQSTLSALLHVDSSSLHTLPSSVQCLELVLHLVAACVLVAGTCRIGCWIYHAVRCQAASATQVQQLQASKRKANAVHPCKTD